MTICWTSHHSCADNLFDGRHASQPSDRGEVLSHANSRNCRFFYWGIFCLALISGPPAEAAGTGFMPWSSPILMGNRSLVHPIQAGGPNLQFHDISGPPGESIPLNIETDGADEGESGRLFIFSGIPEGVTLKPGGYFGQFWAVNSKVFSELTLNAPEGFHGSFTVKVTQTGTSPDDANRSATFTATIIEPAKPEATEVIPVDPPESTASKTVATIGQPEKPEITETVPVESPEPTASKTDAAPPREPASNPPNLKDKALMERATALFSNGDVSGARSVFEYLVSRGNARAAIALGGTYDPIILGQLYIRGLDADPEKASFWYRKAEELGSPDARSRLDALASR